MWNFPKTFPSVIFHENRWQKSCDLTSTVFQIQKIEKTDKKMFTLEWKIIGLAVLSYSMDEILKMYGGIFSIEIHWEVMNNFALRDETEKLRLLITSQWIWIERNPGDAGDDGKASWWQSAPEAASPLCKLQSLSCALREIGGKTHTFWFDWGPAGEPVVVGVRSLAQKPLPYKVNGVFEVIVFCLRKSVLLDVDVFCIRWLLFCFASIFRKKKKKKKS